MHPFSKVGEEELGAVQVQKSLRMSFSVAAVYGG